MADLKFEQSAPRSPLAIAVPVLIVFAALSAGIFFLLRHDKAQNTFTANVTGTQLLPIHTKFDHVFGTPGPDETSDTLYILARVKLDNPSKTPLFLKDITATYTDADGTSNTDSAIQSPDLPRLFRGFPKMQPLAAALGNKPLLRETQVATGTAADGYVIVQFNITPEEWAKRRSATINLAFYHQDTLSIPLPK